MQVFDARVFFVSFIKLLDVDIAHRVQSFCWTSCVDRQIRELVFRVDVCAWICSTFTYCSCFGSSSPCLWPYSCLWNLLLLLASRQKWPSCYFSVWLPRVLVVRDGATLKNLCRPRARYKWIPLRRRRPRSLTSNSRKVIILLILFFSQDIILVLQVLEYLLTHLILLYLILYLNINLICTSFTWNIKEYVHILQQDIVITFLKKLFKLFDIHLDLCQRVLAIFKIL